MVFVDNVTRLFYNSLCLAYLLVLLKQFRGIAIETLIGFFGRKSRLFIISLGFALILLLGILDHLTDPRLSLSIFYLIPIGMVTWFVNRRAGVLISLVGAAAWLAADLSSSAGYSSYAFSYWNAAVRLGFFLIVVFSMSALREQKENLEKRVEERTATLESEIAEHTRTEGELRVSREQLRALAARLESMREEEGKRIAREVHDNLGQALTVLNMNLFELGGKVSELDNEPQRESLLSGIRNMSNLIDTTVHSVREIATELRPRMLDDLGLAAAMEWQARDFQERTGIQCEFISDDINLDQECATGLFRIFQEIMTNVARHSKATRVNIRLKDDTDKIILEVEDDGRGINEEEIRNPRSLGLLGMRERALLFEGNINIRAGQGRGTIVTVNVPIKGKEQ